MKKDRKRSASEILILIGLIILIGGAAVAFGSIAAHEIGRK